MNFDGFHWDDGNTSKCRSHGVSITELESVFAGAPRVGPDPAHSAREQRFRAVGRSAMGRHVFDVFTLRRRVDGLFLRPISARYMHKKEIEAYEQPQEGLS